MTRKRIAPITAGEAIDRMQSDPVFVARQEEREQIRHEQEVRLRAAEAPVVDALNSIGLDIGSCWDLVNTNARYPQAIPTLLEHLVKEYPDEIREGIARALAVPEAKIGRSVLIDEFKKTPDATRRNLKVGLGVAIVATTSNSNLEDVIDLIKDETQGKSRVILLRALRKSKAAEAKQLLDELSKDPTFSEEIGSWRRKGRGVGLR